MVTQAEQKGIKGDRMGVIQGVLREELANSIQLQNGYKRELAKIPKGSLIKKKIKGHPYYYLVLRDKGKVKFQYLGKLSAGEIHQFEDYKKLKAKYRELYRQSEQRIKFIQRALRGKESV